MGGEFYQSFYFSLKLENIVFSDFRHLDFLDGHVGGSIGEVPLENNGSAATPNLGQEGQVVERDQEWVESYEEIN